jgi:hypothetical protein
LSKSGAERSCQIANDYRGNLKKLLRLRAYPYGNATPETLQHDLDRAFDKTAG